MTRRMKCLWLATAAAGLCSWSATARADCSTSTPGGLTRLRCSENTTTTDTTNTNADDPATSDREQRFADAIEAEIDSGVTVDGFGLHIVGTGADPITVINNGTVRNTAAGSDPDRPGDGLRIDGNGGLITYLGNGSAVTTANPLSDTLAGVTNGLLVTNRNGGGVNIGSAAAPVTGNFMGQNGLEVRPTTESDTLGDINAFFSGGTFASTGEDGDGIRLINTVGNTNLTMTGGSAITTTGGGFAGIYILTLDTAAAGATRNINVTTDARIGTAASPFAVGISTDLFADNGAGAININLVDGAAIFARNIGIVVSPLGSGATTVTLAPGTSISTSGGVGLWILGDENGPVTLDIGGSITGGQLGIHAFSGAGPYDITIQSTGVVEGSLFGLLATPANGDAINDQVTISVLGILRSPQVAARFVGTMSIGNGGTTGTVEGNIENGGLLIFSRSDASTYAGTISGTGAVRQAGTGTTILTGASTYAGGTTIERGTLQVGNGGTTGMIPGNVLNNGTLAFNRSDAIGFDGLISGTGALRQLGTGTLTLTGASTYTGGTTVERGTLLVNGSIVSFVQVDAGARLGGTGAVGGGNVQGMLAPGNSIGTLTATGNVTFAAGSTFEVEVDETGASDRLLVGGAATLQGGTVRALFLGNQNNQCGVPIQSTILTAQGGVSGTFSGVTANFAFLTPSLSYDPYNVYLTLARNAATFAERGATANQRESAAAAEALRCGNALFNAAVQLDAASAQAAFDQISGEIHPSTRGALFDDSRFIREAMLAQPAGVRAAWSSAYGSRGDIEGNGNTAALSRDSAGLFIGLDLPFGGGWSAGAAGGYSRAEFDLPARGSDAQVTSWHFGARLAGRFGGLGLGVGGAIAWHRIETARTIGFTGFSDAASARYDGRTAQLFAELNYRVPLGAARIEPFASLAWVDVQTDGFAEAGGAAALSGEEQSDSATFSTLGLRGMAGLGTFELTGSAAWRHAFSLDPSETRFAFASSPSTTFTAAGAQVSEDALALEAGIGAALGGNARLAISYSAQLGDRGDDHGARASLSIRF